jgi:hypothetical protein
VIFFLSIELLEKHINIIIVQVWQMFRFFKVKIQKISYCEIVSDFKMFKFGKKSN